MGAYVVPWNDPIDRLGRLIDFPTPMSIRDDFLAEVEQFLEEQLLEPSAFGVKALKDPGFVFALRKGRAPNLRTIQRVKDFMQAYIAQRVA